MKIIIYLISAFVILVGGIIGKFGYNSKFDKEVNLDKNKLLLDIQKSITELNDFYIDWQKADREHSSRVSKNSSTQETHDSIWNDNFRNNEQYRINYQANFRPQLKKVKFQCETYLNIYRKSEVSFAEYDRVQYHFDIDKIIKDISNLKSQIDIN